MAGSDHPEPTRLGHDDVEQQRAGRDSVCLALAAGRWPLAADRAARARVKGIEGAMQAHGCSALD
jgi:hypothetical protein